MAAGASGTGSIFSPLRDARFRRLFAARSLALVGSGLATIALALLAYDVAGGDAARVLGTALALKMVAYVLVAPVAGGLAHRVPRRAALVALDLARAGAIAGLVWAGSPIAIYLLVFVLSTFSAGFTPLYQAVVPDLLDDGEEYTRGLALSRVSYDLEGLLSPSLAAAVLAVVAYPVFFALNAAAFVLSALLIGVTPLPPPAPAERSGEIARDLAFGVRAYLATPRLRGLLALCTGVAIAGAVVIVDTVVLVRDRLGGGNTEVALALAAAGAGSLLTALATPAILERLSVRVNMLAGAALLPPAVALAGASDRISTLLLAWFLAGVGMAGVQTAAGRVIEASCNPGDRGAYFSAHFSLTHAAWLVAYPMAGWSVSLAGLDAAFSLAFVGSALAVCAGARLWPRRDPAALWHVHQALEHSHAHVHARDGEGSLGDGDHHGHVTVSQGEDARVHAHPHRHEALRHRHRFVIDLHHPEWPREG